jgi:hypothetical protein
VPKGKHILLARLVEPGHWTLVVSSKPVNSYEPSAKLAEVPMTVEDQKGSVEELNIKLSDSGGSGLIEIEWGTHLLAASFTPAKPEAR